MSEDTSAEQPAQETAEQIELRKAKEEWAASKAAREAAATKGERRRAARRGVAGSDRSYSIGPDLMAATATATFDAVGITGEGGDPGTIGKLMLSLQRFLDSVDAELLLTGLNFLSSVNMEFKPKVPEGQRREIERLVEAYGDAPAKPQELTIIVPEASVGLDIAQQLLAESPERVAKQARISGTRTRDALKQLTATMAEAGASLTFDPGLPDRPGLERKVTMEPQRAERVSRALREAEDLDPKEFVVTGKLSLADSTAQRFGLVLREGDRPAEVHHRTKVIDGPYTETARQEVQAGALWDQDVRALILAEMQRPPGGGRPRPVAFQFQSVTGLGAAPGEAPPEADNAESAQ